MILTKEPGGNREREPFLCCLLPGGAAHEKIRGISHLFEHMVIFKLLHDYPNAAVRGHTTEDYIALFCRGIDHRDMMESLRHMTFPPGEAHRHKQMLIEEIKKESLKSEEAFFSFLWQGTPYEKSPLGTIEDVLGITPALLEGFRNETANKPLYFFDNRSGLIIVNPPPAAASCPALRLQTHKDVTYRNGSGERHLHLFYFNESIEALYLLVKVLKKLNPDKQIQLSEKKRAAALVIETGAQFPARSDIPRLRKQGIKEVQMEVAAIKKNKNDRALNELESIYFYEKPWAERLEELSRITDSDLIQLLEIIAARPAPVSQTEK